MNNKHHAPETLMMQQFLIYLIQKSSRKTVRWSFYSMITQQFPYLPISS